MRESFTERMGKKRREAKRRDNALLVGLFVIWLCFGIYSLLQVDFIQKTYLYPFPYQSIILKYADKYQVDSSLAAAVIKSESHFQDKAYSHRGAVGLMQLMPDTAEWIAGQIDDEDYAPDRLAEPEVNIRYGIWYLAELEREFMGNEVLVLSAYNAGRGNVREWMRQGSWDMDFDDISSIPYSETRSYVVSVLKNRQKYKELYPDINAND